MPETPEVVPPVDTVPAAKYAEVLAQVADLTSKLEEMTKDRNAFRAEFEKLKKSKDSALPKNAVVVNGKSMTIVESMLGEAAQHKLKQNVDGAKADTWIQVK